MAGADCDAVAPGAGTTYTFEISDAAGLGSCVGIYTFLDLYDVDGITALASNDDTGVGRCSLLTYTATVDGTHYVKASKYGNNAMINYLLYVD